MLTEKEWAAKFWSKVDIRSPDECWDWQRFRNPHGYGQVYRNAKMRLAHRVAWETTNGPIPEGIDVLHKCDRPPCCNPRHLFPGTQADNQHDAVCKGRHVSQTHPDRLPHGANHWSHRCPEKITHGERHGMARLTERVVQEIRGRYEYGGVLQKTLAEEYGISRTHMSAIIHYKVWKHLK